MVCYTSNWMIKGFQDEKTYLENLRIYLRMCTYNGAGVLIKTTISQFYLPEYILSSNLILRYPIKRKISVTSISSLD